MKGVRTPNGWGSDLNTSQYWYDLVERMFEGQADPNLPELTACFDMSGRKRDTEELMDTPIVEILETHFQTKQRLLIGQIIPVLVIGLQKVAKDETRPSKRRDNRYSGHGNLFSRNIV